MKSKIAVLNNHVSCLGTGAEFSDCGKYRYSLWQIWDETKPFVMFVGLNPSTANKDKNDPTVSRVTSWAKHWGYGGVYMMNCFAFITPHPDKLDCTGDIELNNLWLQKIGIIAKDVVFAWGRFKEVKVHKRDDELSKLFPNAKALVINKDGSPKHPLYVSNKTELVPYKLILKQ